MPQIWRHQLWIVLASAAVLFTNLGGTDLWDRDEPRNAGCAREMLERHDWVVPTFNGELRAHKPVLIYWLMMSAYQVFGVNEFSARFWSALLATGTVLLTYHVGRLLYRPTVGLWAALLLLTSLMFDVAGRAATPDSALLFCTTLAWFCFVRASLAARRDTGSPLPTDWRALAPMYVAMGLAALAKGPVGVLLPSLAIGLYLLLEQPLSADQPERDTLATRLMWRLRMFAPRRILSTIWRLHPMMGLAIIALVALPWYVMVGVRTDGAFLREFLLTHNQARFTSAMENHSGPPFYYLIAVAVGMFPGSVLIGPALFKLIQRWRGRHEWRAADALVIAWAATWIGCFSLASTKLPSYVLPAYPAVALLLGAFAATWAESAASVHRAWFRAAIGALAIVGVALLIGLPIAAHRVLPGTELLGLIGLAPLLGAAACLFLSETGRHRAAVGCFAATAVVFATATFGFAVLRIDKFQNSRVLMTAIRAASAVDEPRIAAYQHFHSTYAYYARQQVDEISQPADAAQLFASRADAFLIVPEDQLEQLRSKLPPDVAVLARHAEFLKPGHLVLLGRTASGAAGRSDTALRNQVPPQ